MAKLKSGSRVYGNLTVDTELLVSTDATVLGNLNVRGNVTTINSTTITVVDPIAQYGRGANNAPLTTNDGKDRGLDLAYFSGGVAKDAFVGWLNSSNTFALGSNVSITDDVVTINTYGDLTMGQITADGGGLSNIPGANVTGWVNNANYANFAGTVVNATQSNITSVGTLTGVDISGQANLSGVTANGVVDITNTTDSTSTTDGALVVAGGAGIAGNLWVGGTLHANVSGSTSAPGANTDIVFNDNGTSNATGDFTFNKTSKTVTVGSEITLDGVNGNANISGAVNFSSGRLDADGGDGIQLYSTSYAQLNYAGDNFVWVDNTGVHLEVGGSNASLGTDGNFTVPQAFVAAGENFVVDQNGNVNAAGTGTFSDVYITNATDKDILFANGTMVYGESSFTYDYNNQKLKVGNVETGSANITGNLKLAGHTAGNLLTTDSQGNVVDTSLSFSNGNLSVGNLSVTNNANVNTLQVTALTTGSVPIVGAYGNVTQSSNLSFSTTTNTLSTTNIVASGNVEGGTVTADNLGSTELVYADATGKLVSSLGMTFASDTLTANNVTSGGTIRGANVTVDAVVGTEVVFAGTGGTLQGDASFYFSNDALNANTINARTALVTPNVSVTSLNAHSVVFAGDGGTLTQAEGLDYFTSNNTLTSNNISATGNITAANMYANTGTIGAANLTGTLTTASQTNVTTVGKLTSLAVTGDVTSDANITTTTGTVTGAYLKGDGYQIGNVTGANVTGTVANANYASFAGQVVDATQSNITAVGTLTSLDVSGNVAAGGVLTDNLYYANGQAWDLQQAAGTDTQIQYNDGNNFAASSNFTFNATTATLTVAGTGNITTVNATNVSATTGNITNVNSTNVSATTGNITTVNATTVVATTGNIATVNATDVNLTGNANITGYLKAGDTTIAGNLVVTGTTTSVNSEVSQLSDPIIELGAGANGAALTMDDGMDRGLVMHTFSMGGAVDVFMGYKDDADEFVLAKNVTVTDNVVDYGTTDVQKQANLADLRLGNIYAYNANFGGVVFSNGNVTLGSGSSFVGNLAGNVSGNISGNITVTGGAGAIQFSNSSNTLVSSAGLNFDTMSNTLTVANTVSANLLTGTLTTAAQPNITSVGTLDSVDVFGQASFGDGAVVANSGGIYTDGYYYANGAAIDFQTASGNAFELQFHADGANDLAASSKLTFDPTAGNLVVNGNIVTGSGSGGNITGADYVVANYFTGTLTTAAQPNITSVGTLTSLTVGDANVTGNLNVGGVIIANGAITGLTFNGDGANLANVTATSIDAGNLTGSTLSSNVIYSSLTTVGTLSSLSVGTVTSTGDVYANTGVVQAQYLKGDGSNIANINGANVSEVANANYASFAGQVVDSTQSNITTVGTLVDLRVHGNIAVDLGNVTASNGTVTGAYLAGDGYQISNITGANVTGYVPNADYATTAGAVDASNLTGTTLASGVTSSSLTSVGTLTSLTVTNDITSTSGTILAGNIGNSSTYLHGDGSNISGVTASSMSAANLTGDTLSSTVIYSSLKSVGELNGLTVRGLTDLGSVGNVKVTGGTTGQYLQTDGSGALSWSTVELSNIHNGTSNVSVANSGNVTVGIAGTAGVINIATTGLTVTGIITATGNITAANIISNAHVVANSTDDAVDAITGAITTAGGISAQGNIYTGNVVGFAQGSGNTDSAAYIKYNATSGSLDFIFD